VEDGAEVWRRFGGHVPGGERAMAAAAAGPPTTAPRPGAYATRESQTAPSTWSPRSSDVARARFGDGSGVARGWPEASAAPARVGAAQAELEEGYEDAPDLVRHLGPPQRRFGAPRRAAPRARALGRFPGYTDEDTVPEALPAARPALPAGPPPFD